MSLFGIVSRSVIGTVGHVSGRVSSAVFRAAIRHPATIVSFPIITPVAQAGLLAARPIAGIAASVGKTIIVAPVRAIGGPVIGALKGAGNALFHRGISLPPGSPPPHAFNPFAPVPTGSLVHSVWDKLPQIASITVGCILIYKVVRNLKLVMYNDSAEVMANKFFESYKKILMPMLWSGVNYFTAAVTVGLIAHFVYKRVKKGFYTKKIDITEETRNSTEGKFGLQGSKPKGRK